MIVDKRRDIESVESQIVLDRLDIRARTEELKLLRNGWFDGVGVAPDCAGLEWLAESFGTSYPDDLPLPYLFPTPAGQVLAEWSQKPWSSSLEIDLGTKSADWHTLELESEREEAKVLDLTNADDWNWLAQEIRSRSGEAR